MTDDPRLARAHHLLAVDRPEAAASELTAFLGDAPDSVEARLLLAQASLRLERYDDASAHAADAVRLAPDHALPHRVRARVELARGRLDVADEAIAESIRLEPREPDAHGIRAMIRVERKEWREALAAAEEGLELDAENSRCTNLAAIALTRLGEESRAAEVLRGQLARSPDDPLTHANQGWTELHAGRYDRALEHFREALRLDPEQDWARRGVLEALRARHRLYRPILRYFLWMDRLSSRAQFGILFGGWIAYQGVRTLAADDSPLRPLLLLLAAAYLVFALSTWFATPLANGLLCLSRFGRLALTGWEKLASAVVVPLLLVGILAVLGALGEAAVLPGLVVGLLAFPLAVTFQMTERKARGAMLAFTLLVAALGGALVVRSREAAREAAALRARVETIAARGGEADGIGAPDPEIERRRDAYEEAREAAGGLAIAVLVLAFFGSQVAGVAAGRWASRR
ncbi:MAG: tetratricopeptide repeat protein [Planctomycetota bacterium JB042]